MKNKIFLVLFELGFGITFNIVGVISLSEIILLLYSFSLVGWINFKQIPILKSITVLYFFLLISQIFSEVLIGNTLGNAIKGFAITIVSYFHFLLLFRILNKNDKLIVYVLLGVLLKTLFFGNPLSERVGFESEAYFKFYYVPIIVSAILILSSVRFFKKFFPAIILIVSLFFIVKGARSAGLVLFLTSCLTFLLNRNIVKKLNFAGIMPIGAIVILLFFTFYAKIYVPQVLSGKWGLEGNKEQLMKLNNPSNPLSLLLIGRTEVYVGAIAFADKFWTGHGAWARDKTGKYSTILFLLKDEEARVKEEYEFIPAHSILIGSGMMNGIVSFIIMFVLLIVLLRIGVIAIVPNDRYVYILVYSLLITIWIALFGPQSQFRLDLPIYFSFFLTLYSRKFITKT